VGTAEASSPSREALAAGLVRRPARGGRIRAGAAVPRGDRRRRVRGRRCVARLTIERSALLRSPFDVVRLVRRHSVRRVSGATRDRWLWWQRMIAIAGGHYLGRDLISEDNGETRGHDAW
jgi:hypothetical protein